MTDTPTGPLLASEVLADQHYANFVGNSDTGFDAEGQVDALLACVPEGRDLVIRADGTMAELPTLSDEDEEFVREFCGDVVESFAEVDAGNVLSSVTMNAARLRRASELLDRLATTSHLPAVREQPRLTEEERAEVERIESEWPMGVRGYGAGRDVTLLLAMIRRIAPPAQDAENREDEP